MENQYVYNENFLAELMEQRGINKSQLLAVIGTKDYASVRRWLNKESPVPIEYMIKICNHYRLNMAVWFKGAADIHPVVESAPQQKASATVSKDMQLMRIQLECERRINELREKHHQEMEQLHRDYRLQLDTKRSKLYDMILTQQKQVEHLLQKQSPTRYGNDIHISGSIGTMVAEDTPTDSQEQ